MVNLYFKQVSYGWIKLRAKQGQTQRGAGAPYPMLSIGELSANLGYG
jgi:hypothetical protein